MENTSNYGLKRWDPEDRILVEEFNDNWDKIDTAIKGSEDKAGSGAGGGHGAGAEDGLTAHSAAAQRHDRRLQHLRIRRRLGSVDGSPFLPDPEAVRGVNLTDQISFGRQIHDFRRNSRRFQPSTLRGETVPFVVYPFSSKNTSLKG